MMSSLVAALALVFVGGPSADGTAVTEVLSNRWLIVGTWDKRGQRAFTWSGTSAATGGLRSSCGTPMAHASHVRHLPG
jgi:hypothetical protein